jgi:hypothetical protein
MVVKKDALEMMMRLIWGNPHSNSLKEMYWRKNINTKLSSACFAMRTVASLMKIDTLIKSFLCLLPSYHMAVSCGKMQQTDK